MTKDYQLEIQLMLAKFSKEASGKWAKYLWRELRKADNAYNIRQSMDMIAESGSKLYKVEAAIYWLEEYLGEGSKLMVIDILRDGVDAGHTKHTLLDAAERIGVIRRRAHGGRGGLGKWSWQLPEHALIADDILTDGE